MTITEDELHKCECACGCTVVADEYREAIGKWLCYACWYGFHIEGYEEEETDEVPQDC